MNFSSKSPTMSFRARFVHLQILILALFASQPALADGANAIQGKVDTLIGILMGVLASGFSIALTYLCIQGATGRKTWMDIMGAIGFCFVGMAASGIVANAKIAGEGTFA